jgi:hypothetical protein
VEFLEQRHGDRITIPERAGVMDHIRE